MADYEQYYEARQHLNLSQLAYDVIDQDRFAFQKKPSFAGMLNRVFASYRDYADAAIDLACYTYRDTLDNKLAGIRDSTGKAAVIDALCADHRENLIQTALSYPKEHPFKFQLNRENYAFLSEWRDPEGSYGGAAGRFLKAVIEEYARKPFVEREAILFRDTIELANDSIDSHRQLAITLNSGKRYTIKPFCVCTDSGNNYHYLTGFSDGDREAGKPVSFRISNIDSCKRIGKSGRLTEAQRKMIREKIQTVGVQFLLQNPESIQVLLTARGKSMYDSQAHLRPAFVARTVKPDGSWLYVFSCTQIQARYYFFKFGAEAQIIQPKELREEFAGLYAESLAAYMRENYD